LLRATLFRREFVADINLRYAEYQGLFTGKITLSAIIIGTREGNTSGPK
jgi:hypothetical protein